MNKKTKQKNTFICSEKIEIKNFILRAIDGSILTHRKKKTITLSNIINPISNPDETVYSLRLSNSIKYNVKIQEIEYKDNKIKYIFEVLDV